MNITITVELHNTSGVLEMDDDELEGLDKAEREREINQLVEAHVLDNMVSWSWQEQPDS